MKLLGLLIAAFVCSVCWGLTAVAFGIDGFPFAAVVFVLALVCAGLAVRWVDE